MAVFPTSRLSRVLSLLTFLLLLSAAAVLLLACAPASAPPAARPADAGIQVPTPAQINGSLAATFLRLAPHDDPPARCDAALSGALAAARGGALCVCQQSAGGRGAWLRAGSDDACWPQQEE